MYDTDKYWCAFAKSEVFSCGFVGALFSYFKDIEHAWKSEYSELIQTPGITKKQIDNFINARKNINPDECLDYVLSRNIKFIHPESSDYPKMLRNIHNSPSGLFVKGDLFGCNLEKTLAAVGSRRVSDYAKTALRKILEGFSDTDICIVSGLAEGTDTVAHQTAIDNNMKTIAIIGGGFDKLYPKSNMRLYNEIIEGKGAVISEYWPDTDAIARHFPVRNRIVSGLAKGVLIAEAALKSGAMITANLALEQGRELMCIPGLITNPNTEGIYKLLKSGAAIITETSDILNQMDWTINKGIPAKQLCFENNLSDEETSVLDYIKKDALTTDELVYKTGISIDELMIILTKMELNGLITQIPGEKYISV